MRYLSIYEAVAEVCVGTALVAVQKLNPKKIGELRTGINPVPTSFGPFLWFGNSIVYLMLAGLTLLAAPVAHCKETIPWEKDYKLAAEKAKDAGKLILIDFFHPK